MHPACPWDACIMISLRRRFDRRKDLYRNLVDRGFDTGSVEWLEAVDDRVSGARGCLMSHIAALRRGMEILGPLNDPDATLCIMEDDARFAATATEVASLLQQGRAANVFMLGRTLLSGQRIGRTIAQIHSALASVVYVVKCGYIPRILEALVPVALGKVPFVPVDVAWRHLQTEDLWLTTQRRVVKQAASFSDVEREFRYYDT